nr:hypothetical protein [Tanacetum cinerariifolium]
MKKIDIFVHHEGIFTTDPFKYSEGDVDEYLNIDLGKTNQSRLVEVIKECCKIPVESIYYCAPKKDLIKHLKPLRNDEELAMFIKTAFDNGGKVDLFVEHHGYDVIAEYVGPENVYEELDEEIEEIELVDIYEYVGPENVGEDDAVITHVGKKKCTSLTPGEIEDNAVDDRFKVKSGKKVDEGCKSKPDKGKQNIDEGSKSKHVKAKSKVNPKSKGNPKPTPNSDCSQKGCAFRAKQMAVYDYEGGLIDHYGKLWDSIHQLLTSNPGFTVELEVETLNGGKTVFKRIGQLLTAMGRDANNQMFLMAWAVVGIENTKNWA